MRARGQPFTVDSGPESKRRPEPPWEEEGTQKMPLERLMHTHEAAQILGVSAAWLERKRWEGRPPRYVRVGGPNGRAIRYRESDLRAYIEENAITPCSIE